MAWMQKSIALRISFWLLCITWILLAMGLFLSTIHPLVDGLVFKEVPGPIQAFEIPDAENFKGGYMHPTFDSWGSLSCAFIPLAVLGLAFGFYALVNTRWILHPMHQSWSPFQKTLLVMFGHGLTLGFILTIFFISQLHFVPPPGSS